MDPTLKMSLVFIAILTCRLLTTASAIKIQMTTNRYNGVVPTSFDVTCSLDPEKHDHYRAKNIVAIKVSRHGEIPLAILQLNSKIFYNPLLKANIKAEGHIDQDPRNTYMAVTFSDAMEEDSGAYNCSLVYWDRWGHMQREDASTNFTVENHNGNDVTRYFIGELKAVKNQLAEMDRKTTIQVEKVETELEHQANDAETVRRHHEKEIDTLNMQNVKQNEEIDALKTQLKTLETQTTKHITKANLQSGFMAALNGTDKLLYHKTIKFKDVQLNIGSHFDDQTSVYTAPWNGLYTFYLTVTIQARKSCLLDIRVNGRVVSRLVIRDSPTDPQSSVSVFLSLKAGDTVDVYGAYNTGSTRMFAFHHTYFSGFLINAT